MNSSELAEILRTDCETYINCLASCKKGHFLLRGYFYEIETFKLFQHNLNHRVPKNMPQNIHNQLNSHFKKKFGWAIRNGIFTYGFDMINHQPIDMGYGKFYLFFPKDSFSFAYSPEYFDLFGEINQLKGDLQTFIDNIDFETENFCSIMSTRAEYDNFANETSIFSESYYLVNPKFTTDLITNIWG